MAPSQSGGKGAAVKPLLAATATEAPDEQLVAAAREGSDEAFEALFRRYRDRVVGYVRGMVSDHGRAEDIVQEAFMSALRSLRRSEQEIVFRPWIYEIAKNACIDHLRRARRAQEVSIDSDDFSPVRGEPDLAGGDRHRRRSGPPEPARVAAHGVPRPAPDAARNPCHERARGPVLRQHRRVGWASREAPSRACSSAPGAGLRAGFDEIDTGARCETHARGDGERRRRQRAVPRRAGACPATSTCASRAGAMRSPWGSTRWCSGLEQSRARRAARRVAAFLPLPLFLRRRLGRCRRRARPRLAGRGGAGRHARRQGHRGARRHGRRRGRRRSGAQGFRRLAAAGGQDLLWWATPAAASGGGGGSGNGDAGGGPAARCGRRRRSGCRRRSWRPRRRGRQFWPGRPERARRWRQQRPARRTGRPARRGRAGRRRWRPGDRPGGPPRADDSGRRRPGPNGRVRGRRRGRVARQDDAASLPERRRERRDQGRRQHGQERCRKTVKDAPEDGQGGHEDAAQAAGQGAEGGQDSRRRLGEDRRGRQDRPVGDAPQDPAPLPRCRRCSCRRCPRTSSPPGLGL